MVVLITTLNKQTLQNEAPTLSRLIHKDSTLMTTRVTCQNEMAPLFGSGACRRYRQRDVALSRHHLPMLSSSHSTITF